MIGKILGLSPEQVRMAKYAMQKRKEGYELLKNPKGTPNTEINMIYTRHGHTLDDFHDSKTVIDRVKATVIDNHLYEDSRLLTSTRFREADTKELGQKRNIDYYRWDNKTSTEIEKQRFDIPEKDLKKRKKPNWQKGFLYDEYYADYSNKETIYNPARIPYYEKPGAKYIVPILSFGMIRPKNPTKPNFFKVLWENLHNSTNK